MLFYSLLVAQFEADFTNFEEDFYMVQTILAAHIYLQTQNEGRIENTK